jgi:hypothetical protein
MANITTILCQEAVPQVVLYTQVRHKIFHIRLNDGEFMDTVIPSTTKYFFLHKYLRCLSELARCN